MWIQGAMHLVLIYYFAATNQSEALREKRRVLGVHPQKYLYTFINSNNSVYIKLRIPWVHQVARRTIKQNTKWCYIGSTSVGALSREHNRRAKVKQCQAGQYVQVEPAIRVWAKSTLPYTSFSTLVVQCFDNYRDAWIQEHILIDSWQARLNFPFIYKFFKKTAFGPQRIKFKNHSSNSHTFTRLFAKVRRRLGTLNLCPQAAIRKEAAFQLLYDSAQLDASSFQAATKIRSQSLTDMEVYALWRIANNLEQPAKTRVCQLLRSAMQFRGSTIPQLKLRLRLPFLAHATFHIETKQWLRRQVLLRKHWLIPLHLPSHAVEEGAHMSVAKLLFNFQRWETKMKNLDPMTLPCNCGRFARLHPRINIVDGHIASSASLLDLPIRLQSLVSYSTSSTVYVGYDTYIKNFKAKVDRWFKCQGFPMQILQKFWDEFFPAQWRKHNYALATQSWRITEAQVLEFKKMMDSKFVLHMADHQATHLMIYCPQFYFQPVLRVWTDETNFVSVPFSQHQCRLHLYNTIAGALRSRYRWGIQANARLPQGFVFLKQKKDYKKGRSVIAYNRTITEKLQRGTASAIEQMLHVSFPNHFGALTLPQIFYKIQSFFGTVSAHEDVRFINDDLIGFFNIVPQARILESVRILLERYCQLSTNEFITVCVARGAREVKSIAGRTKRAGDPKYWKQIQLSDLIPIVEAFFPVVFLQHAMSSGNNGKGHPLAIRFPLFSVLCQSLLLKLDG